MDYYKQNQRTLGSRSSFPSVFQVSTVAGVVDEHKAPMIVCMCLCVCVCVWVWVWGEGG